MEKSSHLLSFALYIYATLLFLLVKVKSKQEKRDGLEKTVSF